MSIAAPARPWLAAIAVIAASGLSACGSDSTKDAAPSVSTVARASSSTASATGGVAPSSTGSSQDAQPSGSHTSAPSSAPARRAGVPAVAYAGAGGPAPSGAQPAASNFYVTKSGNTHCAFVTATSAQPPAVTCYSEALSRGSHQDDTPLGGIASAMLDESGATQAYPQSEAPPYMQSSAPETPLEYDQPITQGSIVCVGASTGTTCWETRTGHGFFISKEQIARF